MNLQGYLRLEKVIDAIDGHILEKLVHDEDHLKIPDVMKLINTWSTTRDKEITQGQKQTS